MTCEKIPSNKKKYFAYCDVYSRDVMKQEEITKIFSVILQERNSILEKVKLAKAHQ